MAFDSIENWESILTLVSTVIVSIVVPVLEVVRRKKEVSYKELAEIILKGIKKTSTTHKKRSNKNKVS